MVKPWLPFIDYNHPDYFGNNVIAKLSITLLDNFYAYLMQGIQKCERNYNQKRAFWVLRPANPVTYVLILSQLLPKVLIPCMN